MLACGAMWKALATGTATALAVLAGAAPGALAQAPDAAPEAAGAELLDRVVAVVNEDPILASDIEQAIGLGFAEPQPEEEPEAFRRRVLDQLIDERLRYQEMDRIGFTEIPVDQVEAQFQAIRDRFADPEAFAARLAEAGLDEAELRNRVARQLMVLTFVDERLGPRVFVDLNQIQAYYQETLVPQLEQSGQEVPPLEMVRESIRRVLKERLLNEELERWTEQLRAEANLEDYWDELRGPP